MEETLWDSLSICLTCRTRADVSVCSSLAHFHVCRICGERLLERRHQTLTAFCCNKSTWQTDPGLTVVHKLNAKEIVRNVNLTTACKHLGAEETSCWASRTVMLIPPRWCGIKAAQPGLLSGLAGRSAPRCCVDGSTCCSKTCLYLWTVFADFQKCFWAHAAICRTESWLFYRIMQFSLIAVVQYWLSALSLTHRYFSRCAESSCTVDDEIVTGFIIVPETENSLYRLMNLCPSSRLRNSFQFPAFVPPSHLANIKISCYFTEKGSFSQIRRLTRLLFSLKSESHHILFLFTFRFCNRNYCMSIVLWFLLLLSVNHLCL